MCCMISYVVYVLHCCVLYVYTRGIVVYVLCFVHLYVACICVWFYVMYVYRCCIMFMFYVLYVYTCCIVVYVLCFVCLYMLYAGYV